MSDGVTVYKPLHGEKGRGTKHRVRWVHLKFGDLGYKDSELGVHLRALAKFYNPDTPEPGSWKLGDIDVVECADVDTEGGMVLDGGK